MDENAVVRLRTEFSVYDRLPPDLRLALQNAPYDLDPVEVAAMLRRGVAKSLIKRLIRNPLGNA
jgi:hypothetical protein